MWLILSMLELYPFNFHKIKICLIAEKKKENENHQINFCFCHYCTTGVLAMNCINEILSKNCVPQEFEDFLLQMFQQTFNLLQKITKESNTSSSGNRLEELDEMYVCRELHTLIYLHFKNCGSHKHICYFTQCKSVWCCKLNICRHLNL